MVNEEKLVPSQPFLSTSDDDAPKPMIVRATWRLRTMAPMTGVAKVIASVMMPRPLSDTPTVTSC